MGLAGARPQEDGRQPDRGQLAENLDSHGFSRTFAQEYCGRKATT